MALKKHIADELNIKYENENYKDLINIFIGKECIPVNKKANDGHDIFEDYEAGPYKINEKTKKQTGLSQDYFGSDK